MAKREKRYTDYIQEVQEKFPELSYNDVRYILKKGCLRFGLMFASGYDFNITHKAKDMFFSILFGRLLFESFEEKYIYTLFKTFKKYRYFYKRLFEEDDDITEFYFGVSKNKEREIISNNFNSDLPLPSLIGKYKRKGKNPVIDFGKVFTTKTLGEIQLNLYYKYIFKFKCKKKNLKHIDLTELKTNDYELLLIRNFDGFVYPQYQKPIIYNLPSKYDI